MRLTCAPAALLLAVHLIGDLPDARAVVLLTGHQDDTDRADVLRLRRPGENGLDLGGGPR